MTKTTRYYSGKEDQPKQIYLKEDPTLVEMGEFHDSMEFIIVQEGRVEAFLDDESRILSEGCIFFADSYEGHCYKCLTEKVRAIVLVMSREYSKEFRELYPNLTFRTFMCDIEKNQRAIGLLREWMKESKESHIKNLGYANLFFSFLSEAYPLERVRERKDNCFVKELLEYIHNNYLEDLTLSKVAKKLGYSADYCSKVLKKYVGRNFRDYLNMLRVRRANELFADKSLNMTSLEILYKCGFNSAPTFYRAKKKFQNES